MQYKYLLILRYSLINLVGLVFLFVLITQGYVSKAIKADITNMVIVILALFSVGFILAAYRTFWLSRELNYSHLKVLPSNSIPLLINFKPTPVLLPKIVENNVFNLMYIGLSDVPENNPAANVAPTGRLTWASILEAIFTSPVT